MTDFPADLAALRDGGPWQRTTALRPVTLKLDSGLSVELPGPRVLADVVRPALIAARPLFRDGGAIVTTDGQDVRPIADDALSGELRQAIAALPDRDDAGRPYTDLRLFVAEAEPDTVAAYLADVVRHVRAGLRPYREVKPVAERAPAMTPAERQRTRRERIRAAQVAASEDWVRAWLEDDDVAPGAYAAADLYEVAVGAIEDWIEDDDEVAVPGRKTFYAVADRLIGRRRVIDGTAHYRKEAAMDQVYEDVVERAAQIVAERVIAHAATVATPEPFMAKAMNTELNAPLRL
ncbi:hypothetical protein [Blastococcus tunisiensis]|uniref:Uncharacterized protein n=1 Tax=Blastococcus tunisiensis TaxID=1798228 RepID=A0A1I2JJV7_9ACTN|nr:hypothetical protein [Blastococcus sp. DSM 46838]SFF52971.1 hypothetical protein SAMN05216574_1167 [Blastococcus sp. DSM 46838]